MNDESSIILAVDDNPANLGLLFDLLDEAGFEVLVSQSGESALKRAENTHPDIILLDVRMPGIDGFETCRQLKTKAITKNIPVMFMTALSETLDKVKGFDLGAVDYITKPIQPEEVLARVRTHLMIQKLQKDLRVKNDALQAKNVMLADREVHLTYLVDKKTRKIENLTLALVNALENANALNDDETGRHIKRVGEYCAYIAEKYECDRDFVKRIRLYAPLHDVGKVGLSDALLKKKGKYTNEEFIAMQQHVVFGARLLASKEIDVMARNIALYHHEKWDGSGYVNYLAGEEIPLEARIVTIVDVYDALISKRIYKNAFSEEEADEIIREESGKHFDPKLVEIFFNHKNDIITMRQSMREA